MSGWVLLALLGVAAAGLLAVLRVPRLLWSLVGAFLMIGAAGYAWQGRPDLPATPASVDAVKLPPDPLYVEIRDAMFGRFGGESVYFGISDRQLEDGDTQTASEVLIGATRYAPKDVAFWTELGNALALDDHGIVSPPALFAFCEAMRVAPDHPGPPFFLGWAYARAGEPERTRVLWARAIALTPPGAEYRSRIVELLTRLDAMLRR